MSVSQHQRERNTSSIRVRIICRGNPRFGAIIERVKRGTRWKKNDDDNDDDAAARAVPSPGGGHHRCSHCVPLLSSLGHCVLKHCQRSRQQQQHQR